MSKNPRTERERLSSQSPLPLQPQSRGMTGHPHVSLDRAGKLEAVSNMTTVSTQVTVKAREGLWEVARARTIFSGVSRRTLLGTVTSVW